MDIEKEIEAVQKKIDRNIKEERSMVEFEMLILERFNLIYRLEYG